MKSFTVYVPATTANMGPGYDVIGMALDIYNQFEITAGGEEKIKIIVEGEGKDEIPKDETNLAYKAFAAGFERAGMEPPNLFIKQMNLIPTNRGMGSSATAALGGLLAAKEIIGEKLSDDDVVSLAVEMEGHPDNLMAAFMGGVTINYQEGNLHRGIKFLPASPLKALLVIPDIQVSTKKARSLLPDSYPISDVVTNLRNISMLVYSLQTGEYELLGKAMDDRIHQPYRAELIPGFYDACKNAAKAGAYGTAISGSGSTVISLCGENPEIEKKIAEAMLNAFENNGVSCRYIITKVADRGAFVL